VIRPSTKPRARRGFAMFRFGAVRYLCQVRQTKLWWLSYLPSYRRPDSGCICRRCRGARNALRPCRRSRLTPEASDYPMMVPNYAASRLAMARSTGGQFPSFGIPWEAGLYWVARWRFRGLYLATFVRVCACRPFFEHDSGWPGSARIAIRLSPFCAAHLENHWNFRGLICR
jgi:hypothetical protein